MKDTECIEFVGAEYIQFLESEDMRCPIPVSSWYPAIPALSPICEHTVTPPKTNHWFPLLLFLPEIAVVVAPGLFSVFPVGVEVEEECSEV